MAIERVGQIIAKGFSKGDPVVLRRWLTQAGELLITKPVKGSRVDDHTPNRIALSR